INPGDVDIWVASEISYAVKIANEWFVAIDGGANDYLGTGPTATINIRIFCTQKNIKILFIEENFDVWFDNHFPKNLKVETNNSINSTDFLNVDEKSVFEKTSQLLVELFSNYEKIPISFTNLHEPDIRNLTVSTLNTHSNFLSKGEVFNNEGKTDLWIYSKLHLYEYFYEFKIWSNSNDIDEGIKQTCTKYSNHKNKCNGLVVFNKKNKDFSSVIQNIKSIILNNKEIEFEQIKEFNSNSEDDNVFTFTYNHPRASAKKCLLKVLIFNLYSDVKKKKGGSSKLKK
ncbi:MAG: hypothetical protein A2309_06540, partial [Bacteroidetes bacterium RIFOXYB2_FULL_35_7]